MMPWFVRLASAKDLGSCRGVVVTNFRIPSPFMILAAASDARVGRVDKQGAACEIVGSSFHANHPNIFEKEPDDWRGSLAQLQS